MKCPKCKETVNACAPHGRVPATFEVEYGTTRDYEPSPNTGTMSFDCTHCHTKLEADYKITELRHPAAINRFGVDTNNLEYDKLYTLHTKEGKVHGIFHYCTATAACFLTVGNSMLIECNATQIAEYEGR